MHVQLIIIYACDGLRALRYSLKSILCFWNSLCLYEHKLHMVHKQHVQLPTCKLRESKLDSMRLVPINFKLCSWDLHLHFWHGSLL